MPGEGPSLWLGAACKARTENEVSAKTDLYSSDCDVVTVTSQPNRMVKVKVKAEGCEASWHMTAKPTGTQPPVGRKFGSDDLGR